LHKAPAHFRGAPDVIPKPKLHRRHYKTSAVTPELAAKTSRQSSDGFRLSFGAQVAKISFRVESASMEYGLYRVLRNYLHYLIIVFARSATGCLSAAQTFVSTTPLACKPNLRTILGGPSGLLRHQPLATTTKTHRQPAVFPNLHTHHDPRNKRHPALPRWPNLRTILGGPSGLLRDQPLATTTKTHRQPAVFPNLHTYHDPRNKRHPALPR
jgi:hypothetical protein